MVIYNTLKIIVRIGTHVANDNNITIRLFSPPGAYNRVRVTCSFIETFTTSLRRKLKINLN